MSTFCDRLEAIFKQRPNEWIDGRVLAQHGGAYAWRSRCADLRKRGHVIENRQRRVKRDDDTTYVISEYRMVVPVRQMELSL